MADVGVSGVGAFTEVKHQQFKPFSLTDSSGQPLSGVFPSSTRPVLGGGGFQLHVRQPVFSIPGRFSITPVAASGIAWSPNYATLFWSATADTALHFLGGKARVAGILGYGGYVVEGDAVAREWRHGVNGGAEIAVRVARHLDLAMRGTITLTVDGPQTLFTLGFNRLFTQPQSPSTVDAEPVSLPIAQDAPAALIGPRMAADALEAERALSEAERLLSEAELPTTPWFRGFLEDVGKYGWGRRSTYAEQRAIFDCLTWIKGPQEWKTVRLRPLSHILRDLDAAIRRAESVSNGDMKERTTRLRERAGQVGVANARAIAAIFAEQRGELRWREIGGVIRSALVKVKPGDTAQQNAIVRHIQDFDEILALVTQNVSLLIPLVSMEERQALHQLNKVLLCLRTGGSDCRKDDEPISVRGLKAELAMIQSQRRSVKVP